MNEMLRSKNLLFVEDNDAFVQNAIGLFEMFFQKVYTASNIIDAMQLYHTEQIDIILTDIHLKSENGLDFISLIRKKDTKTPIVVLSGYKDEELLLRAIPLGLSAYILKPINFQSLKESFDRCVELLDDEQANFVKLKDNFRYDKDNKVIIKEDTFFELNKKEILFFEMLCEHKNQILTKEMFATYVYEQNTMTDSALTNFIMRLRKRFGKNFLHTIPDVGYKLIL